MDLPTSPRDLLLLLLLHPLHLLLHLFLQPLLSSSTTSISSPPPVYALRAVKSAVQDRSPEWNGVISSWVGTDPCGDTSMSPFAYLSSWEGVECRGQGALPSDYPRRVTNLHLPDRQLNGALPPEIGLLRNLIEIDFDSNDLVGPLPVELACISTLQEVDVAANPGLTGIPGTIYAVPPEYGVLTDLVELEFELNTGMSGCLPPGLPPLARTCSAEGEGFTTPVCPAFTDDPTTGTSLRGSNITGVCPNRPNWGRRPMSYGYWNVRGMYPYSYRMPSANPELTWTIPSPTCPPVPAYTPEMGVYGEADERPPTPIEVTATQKQDVPDVLRVPEVPEATPMVLDVSPSLPSSPSSPSPSSSPSSPSSPSSSTTTGGIDYATAAVIASGRPLLRPRSSPATQGRNQSFATGPGPLLV